MRERASRSEGKNASPAALPYAVRSANGSAPVPAGPARHDFAQLDVLPAGTPLDPASRHRFEGRFGRDLGDVRIHEGPAAARQAARLGTSAFTIGHRIALGEPAPRRRSWLLAHELAHVLQQRLAGPDPLPGQAVSHARQPHEREAVRAADAVVTGQSFVVREPAPRNLVHRAPPTLTPQGEPTTTLPTGVLIQEAIDRLDEDDMRWLRKFLGPGLQSMYGQRMDEPPLQSLYDQLVRDLDRPVDQFEAETHASADRLNRMLRQVAPAIKWLRPLHDQDEKYLPGVRYTIVHKIDEILEKYVNAITSSYALGLETVAQEELKDADNELARLPDYIADQYLSKQGLEKFAVDVGEAIDTIRKLRAQAGRAPLTRASDDPLHHPKLDDILRLSERFEGRMPQPLARTELMARLQYARAATTRAEKQARIESFSGRASLLALAAHVGAVYEQFFYWRHLLEDHPILDHFPSRRATCDHYIDRLNQIIQTIEAAEASGTTYEQEQSLLSAAGGDFDILIRSAQFRTDTDDIVDRLKTVATINVIGKIVLITAVASLTAGTAAAGAAAALETGGASALVVGGGELATEALVFTAVSRLGQEVVFGQVEGTFAGDLLTNFLMLGVLKGATLGYGKAFKVFADPRVYKTTFAIGKAVVGLATLQAFGELQHAILTGHAQTGEERYRSIIQNIIIFACLEAAGLVTRPIQERIGTAIATKFGLDKLYAAELAGLRSQQESLAKQFEALKRSGNPDPKQVEGLLKGMMDLWVRELALLDRGARRHAISRAEQEAALKNYQAMSARIELQLANLGVEAAGPASQRSFRPVASGVVAFTRDSEAAIEAFYADKGGKVERGADGLLEGRLPTGEVTFYVPVEEIPATVATKEAVARARDQAERAATADPIVRQGLDRLLIPNVNDPKYLMGTRSADAVLAAAPDVGAFLAALADGGLTKQLGVPFFQKLAGERRAIDFARAYGGKVLDRLYRLYRWQGLPQVLDQAAAQLEAAATPESRKELIDQLGTAPTTAAVDALLGRPLPPKPARPRLPTKSSMGVDRSATGWKVFRAEERKFADAHGETLTDEQLDLRADLKQVVAAAGRLSRLSHASKLEILDRWEALAKQAGVATVWINQRRGALAEALFNPDFLKGKVVFLKGARQTSYVLGSSILDYQLSHPNFSEWVEQKSDLIDRGPKQRDGAYDSGVAAASKYLRDAVADATNLPPGDKISIDFIRDPGPVTRNRMLTTLFAPGSPIYRVRFGTSWYTKAP